MHIWVDADACPVVIKDILFRAAERMQMHTTLIANHAMRIPPSAYVSLYQVNKGFDVADDEIVKRLAPGDLVISSDIPLAAEAIEKGAVVLSPRGELYTIANIKARLTMRDFMESLRSSGVDTGGPPAMNQNDRKNFADQLDKLLTQQFKQG
ncbi:UNVERIFIED_CONTAM: hypothetical protein GTU68_005992 [Idotea baltica]|nr:hypothetical protein [Idotea baltica]